MISVGAAPLEVRRRGGTLGAEVAGVDLAALDDGVFAAIEAAFREHLVLCFRDQRITPADQIAFTGRFGPCPPNPDPHRGTLPGHPEIRPLENRPGKPGPDNNFWHSDVTYAEKPILGALLRAVEVPAAGGDTWFCNMCAAHDRLSPGMQRMLAGLKAVHTARRNYLRSGLPLSAMPAPVEHPVVTVHPATGRRVLYINPHFTERFAGMTEAESRPLIDFLVAGATVPENVYAHRWRPDDVLLWDNRCVMHRSTYNYGEQVRVMHRTTIAAALAPRAAA